MTQGSEETAKSQAMLRNSVNPSGDVVQCVGFPHCNRPEGVLNKKRGVLFGHITWKALAASTTQVAAPIRKN